MSVDVLQDLQLAVIKACEELQANRQLITKGAVKKLIISCGNWAEYELELHLSAYMNSWRLQNIRQMDLGTQIDRITELETELCGYKANLYNAKKTITKLRVDLIFERKKSENFRASMVRQLRSMLPTIVRDKR